jgi:ferric-dicitrate binding protein FerR (iron transport regulator)
MNNKFDKYSDEVAYRVAYLIAGFIRSTLSRNEHNELDEWVAASDENMLLFERLTDEKNIEEATKWIEERKTGEALRRAKEKISFSKPAPRTAGLRFLSYAVAASVIIVAGLVLLKPFRGKNHDDHSTVSMKQDIDPGGNKAVLTLADGRKVILDSAANGVLAREGNTDITKNAGQLEYESNKPGAGEILYNTISTAKGGQYNITLSDGSRVWLNAGSSIYFPVVFNSNERIVTLTGEAYFEVAPSISPNGGGKRPFFVRFSIPSGEGGVVEVLGTHFNVNAYTDEPEIKITLAEGSIKILRSAQNDKAVVLKPGQQAQINRQGEIKTGTANLEEALAWKDGQFLFKDALIEDIMRQVARWYDAEIVYENKPDYHFNATVPRNVPVSKLLHFLELTNRVHFKIENQKIIVLK